MSGVSRSLLFVPGDRPDRFEKAASSGAHEIAIDLEDAVAPAAKEQARKATAAWLGQGQPAGVRINAADTAWFDDDLRMLQGYPAATVMLAKADEESLAHVAQALPQSRLIALIETVKGYMELRRLAGLTGLSRIAFGSVDFGVDSGISDEADAMTSMRTGIVLESSYAGLAAPLDGVSVNFTDDALIRRDAVRSRQLGFGGKLCIHPRQVVAVNEAWKPTSEEIDWARRVLAADEQSGGGATTVDGKMVDKPVVARARRIVSDAGTSQ